MSRIAAFRRVAALSALLLGLVGTVTVAGSACAAADARTPCVAQSPPLPATDAATAAPDDENSDTNNADKDNKANLAKVDGYKREAGADQGKIGAIYETNIQPPDLATAVGWYREGAEDGDPSAEDQLGELYEQGKGVYLNLNAAMSWYRKAAERGLPKAEYDLGRQYAGYDVGPQNAGGNTPDYVAAVAWLSIATAGKSSGASVVSDAKYALAAIYATGGSGVAANPALAEACLQEAAAAAPAAASGNLGARAEVALGDLYTNDGHPADLPKAESWYEKAAKDGDAGSEDTLGSKFEPPAAKTPDYGEALGWFVKAAVQQDAVGETKLGELFRDHHAGGAPADAQCPADDLDKLAPNTRGLNADTKQALCWLTKAADQMNYQAEEDIGQLYCGNRIATANKAVVVLAWFERAAGDGDPSARAWMESAADSGKNAGNADAVIWVKQAAASGDPDVKTWLTDHPLDGIHPTTAIPATCN